MFIREQCAQSPQDKLHPAFAMALVNELFNGPTNTQDVRELKDFNDMYCSH